MAAAKKGLALVTGANKGIGFEVVRGLLKRSGDKVRVLLGCRDLKRGEAAVKKLAADGDEGDVTPFLVDISDEKSIEGAVAEMKKMGGKLSVLVNNAGIAMDGFDEGVVQTTLKTNYHGTIALTEALRPFWADDVRIINVSSRSGHSAARRSSEGIRGRFQGAKTKAEIDALLGEFHAAVKAGDYSAKGWPESAYGVSKLALSHWTRLFAEDEQVKGKGTVSAMCPGWCKTDMTSDKAPRTAKQGAETVVYLATTDEKVASGKFWSDLRSSSIIDLDAKV